MNTWASAYRPKQDNRPNIYYKNIARYPLPKKQLPDTTVLSKCDPMVCFTACLCPDFYPWYISAKSKNGNILTVADTSTMKTFLGKINNQYKAYLWLRLYDEHEDQPIKTSHYFKYKKVKHGFLIAYNSRNNKMELADLMCFVGEDFKVVLVSRKHITQIKGYVI